jgi:hypothetical protein
MKICSAKTTLGKRCTKPAKDNSKFCSAHLKKVKKTQQTGGAKFDDYALPPKTYMYVGAEQKRMTTEDILSLNFKDKVVGTIAGCFCPPHKGHFAMILEACRDNKLDIVFVKTVNRDKASSARHGVPAQASIKILSIYAKYIYDTVGTEVFISTEFIPWDIPNTVDKILNIKVIELEGEVTKQAMEQAKEQEQANPLLGTVRRYLSNFDKVNNTKVFNRVMFRNTTKGVSATNYIRTMKTLLTETAKFLPDFMTEQEKYQLIADIIYDYGTFLV